MLSLRLAETWCETNKSCLKNPSQAEDVVGDPVLLDQVPHAERGREREHYDVVGAELGVDHVLQLER